MSELFNPMSLDISELDEPTKVALSSLIMAVDIAFQELEDRARQENIQIFTGGRAQDLQSAIDAIAPQPGDLKMVYTTWLAAEAQWNRGWRICDGYNGTPKYHPRPDDDDYGLVIFPGTVPWGDDATGTDGGRGGGTTSIEHYHELSPDPDPCNALQIAMNDGPIYKTETVGIAVADNYPPYRLGIMLMYL